MSRIRAKSRFRSAYSRRLCSGRPAYHSPTLLMYTGSTSNPTTSNASMTWWPVMTDTSCSTDRPPKMTATRSGLGILIRQIVLEEHDVARLQDALQRGGSPLQRGHADHAVSGEADVAQPRADRSRLPRADQDGVIADCRGLAAEIPVRFVLQRTEFHHPRRDEDSPAAAELTEHLQRLRRAFGV